EWQASRRAGAGQSRRADAIRRAEHQLERRNLRRRRHGLSGKTSDIAMVTSMAVVPTIASNGVHDRSVSTSVTPPILLKTQKPASFIQEPTSAPDEIAAAR